MEPYEVIDMSVVSCAHGGHVRAVTVSDGAARSVREWTVPEIWTAIYQGQVFLVRDPSQQGARVVATEYCRCGWGTLRTIDSEATEGDLIPSRSRMNAQGLQHTQSRGH